LGRGRPQLGDTARILVPAPSSVSRFLAGLRPGPEPRSCGRLLQFTRFPRLAGDSLHVLGLRRDRHSPRSPSWPAMTWPRAGERSCRGLGPGRIGVGTGMQLHPTAGSPAGLQLGGLWIEWKTAHGIGGPCRAGHPDRVKYGTQTTGSVQCERVAGLLGPRPHRVGTVCTPSQRVCQPRLASIWAGSDSSEQCSRYGGRLQAACTRAGQWFGAGLPQSRPPFGGSPPRSRATRWTMFAAARWPISAVAAINVRVGCARWSAAVPGPWLDCFGGGSRR